MSYSFLNYIQFREFEDVMAQSLDNVELKPASSINQTMRYDFTIDGENYDVVFSPTKIFGNDGILAKNGVNILFHGPRLTLLTGKNKAPTVYRQVFLAIRKYIQQFNPDGLVFYGAVAEQDWMYNRFYERYLKQKYIQINSEVYLSNDYIEKVRTINQDLYNDIQDEIESFNYKDHTDKLQYQKAYGRKMAILAKKVEKSIVKINFLSSNIRVAYVSSVSVENDVANLIYADKTYTSYFLNRISARFSNLKPLLAVDLANPDVKNNIEALQRLLLSDLRIEPKIYTE